MHAAFRLPSQDSLTPPWSDVPCNPACSGKERTGLHHGYPLILGLGSQRCALQRLLCAIRALEAATEEVGVQRKESIKDVLSTVSNYNLTEGKEYTHTRRGHTHKERTRYKGVVDCWIHSPSTAITHGLHCQKLDLARTMF
eukprot:scaffold3057_cov27-Tisochrysis_lutea.AAC.1